MKVFSEALMVDFGWPQNDENLAPMAQDGRQDGPSWGQDGHLEAIWGAISSILGGLGCDL